jgi:hypothetical protein
MGLGETADFITTVRPLSRDPTTVSDPYKELQELLLRSYGLSTALMTSKWLDYRLCGNTRPPSCGTTSPPCSRPR